LPRVLFVHDLPSWIVGVAPLTIFVVAALGGLAATRVSVPAQRRGEIPHGGTALLDDLQRTLFAFEPATEAQKALHGETLHAFNVLIEIRRQRLEAVEYAVPGTLWSVILIGAVLAIFASFVFSIESFWVHATMTGLLATMIGLLVFFMLVTDRPYRGATGVGPQAYEIVLHDLMGDEPRSQ
jgi:hypothetical protein